MSALKVEKEVLPESPEVIRVRLEGSLDTETSREFSAKIDEIISQGWSKVVLDLGGVDFVSSGGWGAIISALRKAHARSGDLVLLNMKGQVKRVFRMLGFKAILKSYDDIEEAVEHLQRA